MVKPFPILLESAKTSQLTLALWTIPKFLVLRGGTALMKAAQKGQKESMELLLAQGANADLQDKWGSMLKLKSLTFLVFKMSFIISVDVPGLLDYLTFVLCIVLRTLQIGVERLVTVKRC